jgi:alpha-galactosidase
VSPRERAERFSFLLPLYMADVARRVSAAVPGAICDFDMTESHRCVGLAFLAAGKFFLINNGPYSWDYDIPKERLADGNVNLFFHAGPARTWFMRAALGYDRWVPSSLLLTHYLPDDGAANQENAVASLVLGQHGIWGDLPAVSRDGQERIGGLLAAYKQVRADVTAAPPVRQGVVGGDGEVHEKLNPANGRGVVCVFAAHAGTYAYVTARKPALPARHGDGVTVTPLPDGRAKIEVTFGGGAAGGPREHGKVIVFGAGGQ